ncbi:hypothetical protein BaRGS_00003424 [Batillaria attramentaria]|uniref:Secreted protein n=1 Tax=Batillaria attramentaria TaxID=370345 RepID=A0ABD0M0Q5_9CAEN
MPRCRAYGGLVLSVPASFRQSSSTENAELLSRKMGPLSCFDSCSCGLLFAYCSASFLSCIADRASVTCSVPNRPDTVLAQTVPHPQIASFCQDFSVYFLTSQTVHEFLKCGPRFLSIS